MNRRNNNNNQRQRPPGQGQSRNARRRRNRRNYGNQVFQNNQQNQNQGNQPRRQNNNQNAGRNPPKISFGNVMQEVGSAVGGMVGVPTLGRLAGQQIGRIFGSGDYIIGGAPTYNTLAGTTPPSFGNISGGARIRHREPLTDLYSSTGYNALRYFIQPGDAKTFPWLSNIALQYEQYKIHGLVFEFKSTSSNALSSANTALGNVGMVTQYNPNDDPFRNKQAAESYMGSQTCSPADSMLHAVECARGSNILDRLNVRNPSAFETPATLDIVTTDWGILNVFTSGSQNVNVIGELWVSYDIEFFKPTAARASSQCDYGFWTLPAGSSTATTFIPASMGGVFNPQLSSFGSSLITNGSEFDLIMPGTMPRGRYLFLLYVRTSPAPTASPVVATTGTYINCTGVTAHDDHTLTWVRSNGTTQQAMFVSTYIDIVHAGESRFKMGGTNNSALMWNCDYILTPVPPSRYFVSGIAAAPSLTEDEVAMARALIKKFTERPEAIEDDKHRHVMMSVESVYPESEEDIKLVKAKSKK